MLGKSSTGSVRTANWDRPPEIFASSPETSTSMAPESSDRTMSTAIREGSTASPGSETDTAIEDRTVISRSLPVIVKTSSFALR